MVKRNEGDMYCKNMQYDKALQLYNEAISLDEKEISYYNTKAAIYYEVENFEKCLETCDQAIRLSNSENYDKAKIGYSFRIKANAMLAL